MVVRACNPSTEGLEKNVNLRHTETKNKTRTGNVYQDQNTLPSMCKGLGLTPIILATSTSTTYIGAEGQSKQQQDRD